MSYALQTLWHEKSRYAAGVGAVAFSALLIVLQVGLLLGLFEITSVPVDHTTADIWVGSQDVKSIDLGTQITANTHMARLTEKKGLVGQPEFFLANYANVTRPDGGMERCFVLGSSIDDGACGAANVLTPQHRAALTEPNSIVIDESEMKRMNLTAVGDTIKIRLSEEVSFLNKASLRVTFDKLPENSKVIIDASHTDYIDFDVLGLIKEFKYIKAPLKNIDCELVGFKEVYGVHNLDNVQSVH